MGAYKSLSEACKTLQKGFRDMSVTQQMMLYAEDFNKKTEFLETLMREQHRETYDLLLKILEIVERIEYNKTGDIRNGND